jgi:hypothetical protein
MKPLIVIGADSFIAAMTAMYKRGEITKEQLIKSVERANKLPEEWKYTEVRI